MKSQYAETFMKSWSTKELQRYLRMFYKTLENADNYEQEERIDRLIHVIKVILEKRGIYVREKTTFTFVKIK